MVNRLLYNRTKKMHKQSIGFLAFNYSQHVWAIDFNGLFLDFSALCKCRLLALHKPFKRIQVAYSSFSLRTIIDKNLKYILDFKTLK